MTKPHPTLLDKYTQQTGQVFINANQALVRLPLDQARRDKADGLKTGGFISGYRGSPLGVYDSALWAAQDLLDQHQIVFQPGLNEELAVSSIRGTQQLNWFGHSDYQGIFGLWYGKGIGVDRACESLKLGNFEGAAKHGGFLVVAGDDHGGKSSDSAHQSEHTLIAAMLPILYPSTIDEIIEFGLLGWQMSRFSGCYVGLKTITDTLDLSACIHLPDAYRTYQIPSNVAVPAEGLNLRENLPPLVEEQWLVNYRLPAATAFARANGIDKTVIQPKHKKLGIIAAGKVYLDVRQALQDLGLTEQRCHALGIGLLKPGLIWPMDTNTIQEFAKGYQALLVVEEKRPVMEDQIARALLNLSDHNRPRLTGKQDLNQAPLLPAIGELNATSVRHALFTLLQQLALTDQQLQGCFNHFQTIETHSASQGTNSIRPAFFCSGCPHNTSTNIPDGAKAMGGIGCHGLVAVVMDRNTMQFLPMGHEGSGWAGVSRFVDTEHMFQNMGDGTYSHSGILAIRAAVAAKANITYKVLYNDAVAMTGGQPVEQQITPVDMVNQLLAEGVRPVHLISDQPEQYRQITLPKNAYLHHRDQLDHIQRQLRNTPGVTGIVYEQTCATEKRRRRKRGFLPDPQERLFIHPEVCEGCGDCSVQSNCISIQPKVTEFGIKREIDQSTCNKDYSCNKGFCPSFVSVTGATIAVQQSPLVESLEAQLSQLPEPQVQALTSDGYNVLVAGIGGTGVLTIGALLGMAAHIENKGCTVLDMTGMAQKGGAVTSHIRFNQQPENIHSSRLVEGTTDLLIAADLIVAAAAPVLKTVKPGITQALLNSNIAPTGDFQSQQAIHINAEDLQQDIAQALEGGEQQVIPASKITTALTGDSIGTNVFMLGYALQKGWLPISRQAIEQAIQLNGTFVNGNLKTLALGRLMAQHTEYIEPLINPLAETEPPSGLEEILASRKAHLTRYQNSAYAEVFHQFIQHIHDLVKQKPLADTENYLAQVALSLSKLMAYKDEYEIARLYTAPEFKQRLQQQFSGKYQIHFNLAPPLLPGKTVNGRPKKRQFGRWILPAFNILTKLKGLRGTVFDIFGHTVERRQEKALIKEYRELIISITDKLTPSNIERATAIAAEAQAIAGYGPVKLAAIERYRVRLAQLLNDFSEQSQSEKRQKSKPEIIEVREL